MKLFSEFELQLVATIILDIGVCVFNYQVATIVVIPLALWRPRYNLFRHILNTTSKVILL